MKTTNNILQSIINEIIENCGMHGNPKDLEILNTMNITQLEFILDSSKKYIYDKKQ